MYRKRGNNMAYDHKVILTDKKYKHAEGNVLIDDFGIGLLYISWREVLIKSAVVNNGIAIGTPIIIRINNIGILYAQIKRLVNIKSIDNIV